MASPTSVSLDERYGRTAVAKKRNRWLSWGAAASFVIVFTAWVIWGGLDGSADRVGVLDTGYSVIDAKTISVTWQVTVDPGTATACAVQAQNDVHGIVGWKIVELQPSQVRTRSFTESLTTTEQAVTGLIYRCWLA